MFHTVAQIEQAEPDMGVFRKAWSEIQFRLESPILFESEIFERGIPEGEMYASFRGYLNGRLVNGRLVKTREGNILNIDYQFDTSHLRELQAALERRIGRLIMIER